MKRSRALISLSLALALLGCQESLPGDETPSLPGTSAAGATIDREAKPDTLHALPPDATLMVDPNRRLVGSSVRPGQVGATSISDWSGTVHMRMWSCSNGHSPVAHPVIRCSVDPGWVLVGGGARADANTAQAGALLTANYPFDPSGLTTWEGRSKDHQVSDPHVLHVFAIGLSLSGVSASTLRANIAVAQATSGTANHPVAELPAFSSEFLDLSGGAFVAYRGAGNMLVTNFPWVAQSKDHFIADPATITLYRLAIRAQIPGFSGQLEQTTKLINAGPATGVVLATATLDTSFVPVGVGGFAGHNNNPGRMLFRVGPTDLTNVTSFTAGSKDHGQFESGSTFVLLNQLRKRP